MYITFLNKKKRLLIVDTVKARKRQGTNSLDITIPTKIVIQEEISAGDIFEVNKSKEGDSISIKYKLIYKQKKS